MTPRRRSPKPSAATEPKNGTFANSVLLEDLRGQMKVIAEGLLDRPTRTELEARFHSNETKFESRFDRIDQRLDANDARFAKLENQIALLIDTVTWTREDVRSLRQDLANQSQASELRVLDRRVTVLEQQRVGG